MVSLNLACSPDSTYYFILTFCWELKINADNYNYVQPITKVDLLEMFHSFSPVGFLQLESEWEKRLKIMSQHQSIFSVKLLAFQRNYLCAHVWKEKDNMLLKYAFIVPEQDTYI